MKAKRRKADEYRREAKKSKSEEEKKGFVAKAEACIKAASDIKVVDKRKCYLLASRIIFNIYSEVARDARGAGSRVAALQQLRRARRGRGEGDLVVGAHTAEVGDSSTIHRQCGDCTTSLLKCLFNR